MEHLVMGWHIGLQKILGSLVIHIHIGLDEWMAKTTSWYSFIMGSTAIAWSTNKQPKVSLSTTEAEYKAIATTTCEAVWLRRILKDLHEKKEKPTQLVCDNQSVIQMTKNLVFNKKTKNIDIRYHFVWDLVQ